MRIYSCTLHDAVLNALHELSCGLVAEYRLLALSLRACRVRDVVFSGLVFLFCVSVPTIMLHPRLVVLFSMLACVSAVPASEEQSLTQLYKATQVCGCSWAVVCYSDCFYYYRRATRGRVARLAPIAPQPI